MRAVSTRLPDSIVPRLVLWISLAGLVPSIAMPVAMLAWPAAQGILAALGVAYGAMVASFGGGAWWGMACGRAAPEAQPRLMAQAMVPGLVAWPVLLAPPTTSYLVLALLFAVLPPTERRFQQAGLTPAWWFALRHPLCHAMAALHAAAGLILMVSPAG